MRSCKNYFIRDMVRLMYWEKKNEIFYGIKVNLF